VSGQYALGIPLSVVLSDTKKDIEKLRTRDAPQIGVIERNRWIAHNSWVVAGTRIPVEAIKSFHAAGYSVEQIIGEYPDLTRRDVEAALAHKGEKNAA